MAVLVSCGRSYVMLDRSSGYIVLLWCASWRLNAAQIGSTISTVRRCCHPHVVSRQQIKAPSVFCVGHDQTTMPAQAACDIHLQTLDIALVALFALVLYPGWEGRTVRARH